MRARGSSPCHRIGGASRPMRRPSQTSLAATRKTGAAAPSAEGVDLDREQAGQIINVQQMKNIEAVGLSDHHLGWRKRKSEIAGRRQPTFIAVVQQILLGRADHLLRTLGRLGDALAQYEGLARHVRGWLRPSTHPIDTI